MVTNTKKTPCYPTCPSEFLFLTLVTIGDPAGTNVTMAYVCTATWLLFPVPVLLKDYLFDVPRLNPSSSFSLPNNACLLYLNGLALYGEKDTNTIFFYQVKF
jgi:hypothetical protein